MKLFTRLVCLWLLLASHVSRKTLNGDAVASKKEGERAEE